jgi:hypothetical protein
MAATAHARRSWRGSGGEGGWQAIGGSTGVLEEATSEPRSAAFWVQEMVKGRRELCVQRDGNCG